METSINNEDKECQELKNIKYKTMLLNGKQMVETLSSDDLTDLNNFLEVEQKSVTTSAPWNKLSNTIKMQKITLFALLYQNENNMDDDERTILLNYLKDTINKKKLSKVKDILYDKEKGIITQIPGLHYNKQAKNFTIKNNEKRVSTSKSLPPKKQHGTIKNKESVCHDTYVS